MKFVPKGPINNIPSSVQKMAWRRPGLVYWRINTLLGLNEIIILARYALHLIITNHFMSFIAYKFLNNKIEAITFITAIKANGSHTLQWRHNGCDGVSNHQPYHCLLNRLFRRRSKKKSELRVTGLCVGNSPVTVEFPAQMASNSEIFPFDDVIMRSTNLIKTHHIYIKLGIYMFNQLTIT